MAAFTFDTVARRLLGVPTSCEKRPRKETTALPPPRWCGMLVRTPAVHIYGLISDHLPRPSEFKQEIPWQSADTSLIPSMIPALNFRTHLTFCLVPWAIWKSPNLTIRQKLAESRLWSILGEKIWLKECRWTEKDLDSVIGIETLGLVKGDDTVTRCNQYFEQLCPNWYENYMAIWWNDMDFAIILSVLVMGPAFTAKCKQILDAFERLRMHEVIMPRSRGCDRITVGSWMAITGAAIVSGCMLSPLATAVGFLSFMGSMAASTATHLGEESRLAQRVRAYHNLAIRFPQLEVMVPRLDDYYGMLHRTSVSVSKL